eukprot:m51a1_g3226 hypothetical protein (192) ;mRNA; f:87705-88427
MQSDFAVAVVLACASLLGVGCAATRVPFPEKATWLVFFLVSLANGLCHALYQWGGYFVLLFPALFWIQVVQETTGSLALSVSLYSRANQAKISAHWYSLPTGSSSLAMLCKYFPAKWLQVAYLVPVIAYVLAKAPHARRSIAPAVALAVASPLAIYGSISALAYNMVATAAVLLAAVDLLQTSAGHKFKFM